GQLAQRSLVALRKFFPKVVFSTTGVPPQIANSNGSYWYDFNGNGVMDGPYILQGHECLVFFLGGIPLSDNPANPTSFGMTGFGKARSNPFSNSLNNGNGMYTPNRQPPLFEFNAGRLFLDPDNQSNVNPPQFLIAGVPPGPFIPGYYDSLGNAPPGVGG